MKIRPVGVESFHADGRADGRTGGRTDGRTDMKLIVFCRSFVNSPKKGRAEKSHYCPTQAIK